MSTPCRRWNATEPLLCIMATEFVQIQSFIWSSYFRFTLYCIATYIATAMFAQIDKQTDHHAYSFSPNICAFLSHFDSSEIGHIFPNHLHIYLHLALTPKSANRILTIWDVN